MRSVFSVTQVTNYLYDRDDLIEEVDNGGGVLARYNQGPGIDQPLSMRRGSVSAYYLSDASRSITSFTDSTGSLINTYTYDSFGQLITSAGTLKNAFQFTGREFDQGTGDYYYRARYYDREAGRFASEDPVRFFGGKNFYDYALNNPTNMVDPTGMAPLKVIHGNWCGPNWTGGHFEMYDPAHDTTGPNGPYYNNPIDYTDETCKDHDICYYRCRRDHKCDQGTRRNCMRDCDEFLVYELTRFPERFEGVIDALAGGIVSFGIAADSYYPDADENDKSCPNCPKSRPRRHSYHGWGGRSTQ